MKRPAIYLFWHAALGAIILAFLLIGAPKFEKILMDFHTKLPEMTILVIDLSHLAAKLGLIAFPGVLICDFAVMLAFCRSGKDGAAKIWAYLISLAEVLLIGFGLLALFLPLMTVITPLSGGQGDCTINRVPTRTC